MKRKPIYVGICNLKGGCGKSVITTVLASILHYTTDKNVVIIDGDSPQFSISSLRNREIQMVEKSNYYKGLFCKQCERTQKKGYKILESDSLNIMQVAEKYLLKNEHIDVVFFDLPSSMNELILGAVLNFDYVFCPMITDQIVLQSSLTFMNIITKFLEKKEGSHCPLKDIYVFWNMINKRENRSMYNIGNNVIKELKVKKMNSELPETKKYKKEISAIRMNFFRSTLFSPNPTLMKGTGLAEFIQEFRQIIKL